MTETYVHATCRPGRLDGQPRRNTLGIADQFAPIHESNLAAKAAEVARIMAELGTPMAVEVPESERTKVVVCKVCGREFRLSNRYVKRKTCGRACTQRARMAGRK